MDFDFCCSNRIRIELLLKKTAEGNNFCVCATPFHRLHFEYVPHWSSANEYFDSFSLHFLKKYRQGVTKFENLPQDFWNFDFNFGSSFQILVLINGTDELVVLV